MDGFTFILMRLLWKPWRFLAGEYRIRRALRQLSEVLAAPPGTYDRFEIRLVSRHVSRTITLSGHPPYWDKEWHRAARISEDMRHPRGIGCRPDCRHNRAA